MTAKIKLNAASGGGSFSLQAPSSSANNRVFTLPDSADATILTSTTATGKILQIVPAVYTAATYESIDANTEYAMTELTASIQPSSTSNKVLFICTLSFSGTTPQPFFCRLKRGGSDITAALGDASGNTTVASFALGATSANSASKTEMLSPTFQYLDTPSSTSSLTYSLGIRHASSATRNFYINRSELGTNNSYYYRTISTMTLMEIAN